MTTLTNALPEQAVLGCLLQGELASARELVTMLNARDFTDPRHRAVFEAARSCVESGTAPDPVVVLARFRQQGEVLADTAATSAGPFLVNLMQSAPSLGSATWYANALINDAFRRRVQETGERLCQVAETASQEVVLEVMRSEWSALAAFKDRLPMVTA